MNRKVKHGSLNELNSLDAREQRHSEDRSSETGAVQRKGFRKWLVGKMEEYDPGGKRAHEITKKYR